MSEHVPNPSRRRFIKTGVLAGVGLTVGLYFGLGGEQDKPVDELWENSPDNFAPNVWIQIDNYGMVTIRVNHTEMGQGITTALPMIVAEELEADWSMVRVEVAPAESAYKNPAFNSQMTAASTSVRTSWDILRHAGAAAREMLVESAARIWNVPPSECRASKGTVRHDSRKRTILYGDIVKQTNQFPEPKQVRLKDPQDFQIVGKDFQRLDVSDKIQGRAVFGMDVQLPGLLIAAVLHPPVWGGKATRVDSEKALKMPGVRRVLEIENAVAVAADTIWQAQNAADALNIDWDLPTNRDFDDDTLRQRWSKLAAESGKTISNQGDVSTAMAGAHRTLEAVYELPFQAHATPEPMNCTAHVQSNKCEIWAPTQNQDAAQEIAARITGLPYKHVYVHTTYVGGGFGRRVVVDYVAQAVQISKAVNAPVKVIWTREQDMRNDFYRPATYNAVRAGLDKQGQPIAWSHRIVGPDHMSHMIPKILPSMLPYFIPRGVRNVGASLAGAVASRMVPGKKISEGAAPFSYGIENVWLDYVKDDPGVPIGFWRSVGHSHNAFVVECFMDEIACSAGRDPIELRLDLLNKNPRFQNVIKHAAEKSSWENPLPSGMFRGVAAHDFHDTLLCCVVEISVDNRGQVKVHRAVMTVDCGTVINPKIVRAQISGGIAFGLTATLKSSITLKKGRVEQGNFDDFPLLRMDEMPQVDVHIVPSHQPPTGLGESAVPLIGPAVANAVFAATGKRIRKLPISPKDLVGQ
jgi:isoquinoline 1-oxidoreductase beta subunit